MKLRRDMNEMAPILVNTSVLGYRSRKMTQDSIQMVHGETMLWHVTSLSGCQSA